MASKSCSRNPFLAWWIGLAITAAAVAFVGYQFTARIVVRPKAPWSQAESEHT
jgi:hypothetical protein